MATDGFAESDGARRLESCDRAGRELPQFGRLDCRSGAKLNDADDLFAEAFAGPADYNRVDDVGVAPQHLLAVVPPVQTT
jgi:hypothetical protein